MSPKESSTASFDRTYEGLKPLSDYHCSPPSPPFDRTYEGLKPVGTEVRTWPEVQLLTVPMRV